MQGVIPILDFTGIGNYRLLYDHLFMEEFRDSKTGLYLIGIGCSLTSVQLHSKLGRKSHTFLATLMAEYDIYADPDSLDYPLLADDPKGVLHTSGLLGFSQNFFDYVGDFFGKSYLSKKDKKRIIGDALNNPINRNELGDLIIKELKGRNISEDSKLYTVLQQYEEKNRKIIPLGYSFPK